MKWEKPAEGIMKTGDWGLTKTYHIRCECGSSECTHDVWIEADDMQVTVTTHLTMRTKWHNMSRWKQIWTILTKGYLDTESTLVMNRQTAMNYAATLKAAVEDVEKLRSERKDAGT